MPRHGFEDEAELEVLNNWDYSKLQFVNSNFNSKLVMDGKLFYKNSYLLDHFKGMGMHDFKTKRDVFDRVNKIFNFQNF